MTKLKQSTTDYKHKDVLRQLKAEQSLDNILKCISNWIQKETKQQTV